MVLMEAPILVVEAAEVRSNFHQQQELEAQEALASSSLNTTHPHNLYSHSKVPASG
jgi:hypothetical protein